MLFSTIQPAAESRRKSKQMMIEMCVSHNKVVLGNCLSHKTQKDHVYCDDNVLMPTGLASGIFKDASQESSEAVEEQSAALFKCSSDGFMASLVVTYWSCGLFEKHNLAWEGKCEQVGIQILIH